MKKAFDQLSRQTSFLCIMALLLALVCGSAACRLAYAEDSAEEQPEIILVIEETAPTAGEQEPTVEEEPVPEEKSLENAGDAGDDGQDEDDELPQCTTYTIVEELPETDITHGRYSWSTDEEGGSGNDGEYTDGMDYEDDYREDAVDGYDGWIEDGAGWFTYDENGNEYWVSELPETSDDWEQQEEQEIEFNTDTYTEEYHESYYINTSPTNADTSVPVQKASQNGQNNQSISYAQKSKKLVVSITDLEAYINSYLGLNAQKEAIAGMRKALDAQKEQILDSLKHATDADELNRYNEALSQLIKNYREHDHQKDLLGSDYHAIAWKFEALSQLIKNYRVLDAQEDLLDSYYHAIAWKYHLPEEYTLEESQALLDLYYRAENDVVKRLEEAFPSTSSKADSSQTQTKTVPSKVQNTVTPSKVKEILLQPYRNLVSNVVNAIKKIIK